MLQVAREYREDVGSPSYQQILHVLNRVNEDRARKGEAPVTFRQAVHAMGLKDPFTGKIKSGVYVPTLERLVALAEFLRVEPTIFDTYVKRFADKMIREDQMIETFRKIASLNEGQREIMISAIDNYAEEIIRHYERNDRRRRVILHEPLAAGA